MHVTILLFAFAFVFAFEFLSLSFWVWVWVRRWIRDFPSVFEFEFLSLSKTVNTFSSLFIYLHLEAGLWLSTSVLYFLYLYISLCPGSWLSTLIIFFPSPLYVGRGPWLLCIFRFIIAKQERPYQHDSTASRLLSEVKHARAQLVLRWGTTLESWVLFFLAFFHFFSFGLRRHTAATD